MERRVTFCTPMPTIVVQGGWSQVTQVTQAHKLTPQATKLMPQVTKMMLMMDNKQRGCQATAQWGVATSVWGVDMTLQVYRSWGVVRVP